MNPIKLNIQRFGATSLASQGLEAQLTPQFFNQEEYQIQLKENFIIVFESNQFLGDGFELIAESVSLPQRQIQQIPISYGNKTINVAGRNSFTNMTINVRDVINADTELKITKWCEAIVNTNKGTRGIIGDSTGKNGYKIDIEIIPLTPNGDKGRPSIARGCFPINVNWGDLSYTDTGIRTLSLEVSVDDYARKEVFDGDLD